MPSSWDFYFWLSVCVFHWKTFWEIIGRVWRAQCFVLFVFFFFFEKNGSFVRNFSFFSFVIISRLSFVCPNKRDENSNCLAKTPLSPIDDGINFWANWREKSEGVARVSQHRRPGLKGSHKTECLSIYVYVNSVKGHPRPTDMRWLYKATTTSFYFLETTKNVNESQVPIFFRRNGGGLG